MRRTFEPDHVNFDFGGRLWSDLFNQVDTQWSLADTCGWEIIVFQKNSKIDCNIYSKEIFLCQNKSQKMQNQQVPSITSRVMGPEIEKSRNPEIKKNQESSDMSGSAREEAMSQWDSEPNSQWSRLHENELSFAFVRSMFMK